MTQPRKLAIPAPSTAPTRDGADPHTVTGGNVRTALAALGVGGPAEDIARVEISPSRISVVRLRRDQHGHLALAGGDVATTTTTIGIDWSR